MNIQTKFPADSKYQNIETQDLPLVVEEFRENSNLELMETVDGDEFHQRSCQAGQELKSDEKAQAGISSTSRRDKTSTGENPDIRNSSGALRALTSVRRLVTCIDMFLARNEEIAGDHRAASEAVRDSFEMYEKMIGKMRRKWRTKSVGGQRIKFETDP